MSSQYTLFNTLREQISLTSSIAYEEPGLPRFSWDPSMRYLSIDGKAIALMDFYNAIHTVVRQVEAKVGEIFGECEYEDIMKHIDAGLDLSRPSKQWFRESPQTYTRGTSVFNNSFNGFDKFRMRLVEHMAKDDRFFYTMNEETCAKVGNLWEWFGDLDALQPLLYSAMVSSWGGGARGTECDHLEFEIGENSQRQLFILNGHTTIVTQYTKQRSHQGKGKQIARVVPRALARLMLLIYGVVYPAASFLAPWVLSKHSAEIYRTHMFVYRGRPADSDDFSKFLMAFTERQLGVKMGLRDWRQVMCTILVNITRADFCHPDEDDQEMNAIHAQFAHSPLTASRNYALQISNALAAISHTDVASNQRVSLMYHSTIGMSSPGASVDAVVAEKAVSGTNISELEMILEKLDRKREEKLVTTIMKEFTNHFQGFSSQLLKRMGCAQSATTPIVQQPSIVVHPGLLNSVATLLPRGSPLRFTIPQQAEALQSCTTSDHFLVVMPTGSGKSLSFFGAALLYPDQMFVLITPLVALTDDMARRLAATEIPGGKWRAIQDPFEARIVLVSAHEAATVEFIQWLGSHKHRIGRIFIDEVHHVYTSDNYRDCFKGFYKITRTGLPLTLLSATVFPMSVPHLCDVLQIDYPLLRQIRAPTVRSNLKFTRTRCEDPEELFSKLEAFFNRIKLDRDDRGFIYCVTVADCKAVGDLLGISSYHAEIVPDSAENSEIQARLKRQWWEGVEPHHRWMAATLCFGQGIDYPRVRWCIHVQTRNIMSYVQETGRAGRDGQLAYAHLFYSTVPDPSRLKDKLDHEGVGAMRDFIEMDRCRRISIGDIADGGAHCCAALNAVLCDACENVASVSATSGGV